jgi:hypothetical protein
VSYFVWHGYRRIRILLVLPLALLLSGCTIRSTRLTFGATVILDAASTQAAVSGTGREASPVLAKAPLPIMLGLSAIVAMVAEHHVRNGETEKAKTLYTIASVIHGAAGAWNLYQASRFGVWNGSTATAQEKSR